MAGEKLFSIALFGFKKKHVNDYLERLNKEYEEKLKTKEKEISDIKAQYRDVKSKYDEISKNLEQIQDDREKIANALITAQEKAETIINEAKLQALNEKKNLEKQVEEEKERLVDIKEELKVLKVGVVDKLKKYEGELEGFISE
jgi:chromosome segregation ATPase